MCPKSGKNKSSRALLNGNNHLQDRKMIPRIKRKTLDMVNDFARGVTLEGTTAISVLPPFNVAIWPVSTVRRAAAICLKLRDKPTLRRHRRLGVVDPFV